jgi:hypothetical protein
MKNFFVKILKFFFSRDLDKEPDLDGKDRRMWEKTQDQQEPCLKLFLPKPKSFSPSKGSLRIFPLTDYKVKVV